VNFGVWDGLVVASKAVTYAATFGASGGVFFLSYSHDLLENADALLIRRLVRILMIAAVLASVSGLAATAALMSGDASGLFDTDLMRMVWKAGEGRAIVVRIAGLLVALLGVRSARRPTVWALVAAGCAATSFAWVGHVHALAARGHAIASDWPLPLIGVHLLSVAFWLGALGPLLVVTRHDEPRQVAATVERFGTAAAAVVGALVIAGVILLCVLIGNLNELWTSRYGCCIIVKLGLVACLLALAAFNKLRLTRRLLTDDSAALRSLRTSIRAEMVLAVMTLIVTAALTTLTGPPVLE
jgi:copper resistance protein D